MKFDLKTPCKNCPFRNDETAIRFACRERAEEIMSSAMRVGFPCHLSAHIDEEDDDAGYEFGPETQHCAGALIFMEKQDSPHQMMRIAERLGSYDRTKLDMNAPVWEDEDAFLDSYEGDGDE